jgi:hypothetical protein
MSRNINALISRHTTQWFHRVNLDELSPAIYLQEITTRILQFIEFRKLQLNISTKEFRLNLCEFLCTYYVAKKRDLPWSGPNSQQYRPRGWCARYENEWQEYIRHNHFTSEFWYCFWESTPEALWESRVPGWRDALELIVPHYLAVQPSKIDLHLDLDSEIEEGDALTDDDMKNTARNKTKVKDST